jgi:predicted Zn-dependent peptidase
MLQELDRVRAGGITPAELESAKTQLTARLVFDNDSVTNIAHQLGYFATIASVDLFAGAARSIQTVTLEQAAEVARDMLTASNRTIGWFDPLPTAADATME